MWLLSNKIASSACRNGPTSRVWSIPVSYTHLDVYKRQEKGGGYSPQQTYQADKQGTLKLDFLNSNKYWYNAHTAADNAMTILNLWKNDYYYNCLLYTSLPSIRQPRSYAYFHFDKVCLSSPRFFLHPGHPHRNL